VTERLDAASVLITGGSRGIGRLVAAELAAAGARLILVSRSRSALEETLATLPGTGHRVVAADVVDAAALRSAVRHEARLDGLVAAAGTLGPIGRIGNCDLEAFRSAIEVNLLGVVNAVAACLPLLRTGGGSIVTLSGGGATSPLPRFDAYASSKAAVVRLTENLARDLAADGVRCNSVAPGFIPTQMHQDALAAGPDAVGGDYYERTRRGIEEGEHDPPELPGRLARFLLSDASRGITGKLLSARWDPWGDPGFQQRLRDEPDLATLRRIDDQFFTRMSS
jgi:NAD(P)-dependent dehydrogenase (short-subunit alcohol dehydrogenase family)